MSTVVNQVVLPAVTQESIFDDSISPPNAQAGGGYVVGNASELQVQAQNTPDMTVKVTSGIGYNAKGSRFAVDPIVSITITAADATNPRNDIIVIDENGIGQVRTGTPANPANDPTLNAGDLVLARVQVAANATTITGGNIFDLRNRRSIQGKKIIKGSVTPYEMSQDALQSVNLTLNATAVKALATTQFTIINSYGPNQAVVFLGAGIAYDWDGGTAYTIQGGDDLVFRYQNGSGNIVSTTIETTGFLDQTADKTRYASPLDTQDNLILNQPVVLDNIGTDVTLGTSPLKIVAWYRVWSTGL